MYVVTCASARTGGRVARQLLEAGRKVRVVVRNPALVDAWRERGAEVAVADYADVPAMTDALRGAIAAYVIPPPQPVTARGHHAYRLERTAALASALGAAGVAYVVSLSSFAAQHAEGTGMIKSCYTAERILERLPKTVVTHLRPAFFIENWAAQIPAVRAGTLPSFLGPADRKFTMVGTADIANVATRLMLEPSTERRVVELTGPEDYSVADVARTFARLLERQVEPAVYPVAGMAAILVKGGFASDVAADYQELFAGMMTGHVALEGRVPLQRGTLGLAYTLGTMLGRG